LFFHFAQGVKGWKFRDIQGKPVVGLKEDKFPSRRLVMFHAKCSVRRFPISSAPLDQDTAQQVVNVLALPAEGKNVEGSEDAIDPLADQALATQIMSQLAIFEEGEGDEEGVAASELPAKHVGDHGGQQARGRGRG
jgi:hypothetical protein